MAAAAMKGKLMSRFTTLPITLYRIQPRLPVSLRDKATQTAKNRLSFDLILHDSKVHPMPAESHFHTPNGMSLRPMGDKMIEILRNFRGDDLRVYRLQEGTKLPEDLCVFHEHGDHYSMQVARPMPLPEFNEKLTELLKASPSASKQEMIDAYDDIDDQDN